MGVGLVKTQVDVLLAAYNGVKYLPAQADSLDRQLWRDYRVLWQDDGSTDGTDAFLQARSANNARWQPGAEQGKHLGAAGNFFSLLRQSDAPYAALCDQDDVWAPDHLSALLDAMQKAEASCGSDFPLLVYSDAAAIDADGKLLYPSVCLHQGWKRDALNLKELIVQTNAIGCTMLINRPLRDLITAHLPTEPVLHDWFIAMTAASFGGAAFVSMPLVDYRQHGNNAIGASTASLPARAMGALRRGTAVRARIELTYRNAACFLRTYGADLPEASADILNDYLATEHMPKLRRIFVVQREGYRMQNPLFRLGQLLWG